MHDLGLGDRAEGHARFEVEGADLAASVLRSHGVPEAGVDRVWEAIALHSLHGIADRRGLLTYLTYKGVFVDVGHLANAIDDQLHDEVLDALPKPPGNSAIFEAILVDSRPCPRRRPLPAHSPRTFCSRNNLKTQRAGRRQSLTTGAGHMGASRLKHDLDLRPSQNVLSGVVCQSSLSESPSGAAVRGSATAAARPDGDVSGPPRL